MGAGYLLPTLAAVFVGGTSVFGGRGSIWGTFIGAFMIGGITAGIVAVGLTDYYTSLIYGAVILISVSIHAVLQRGSSADRSPPSPPPPHRRGYMTAVSCSARDPHPHRALAPVRPREVRQHRDLPLLRLGRGWAARHPAAGMATDRVGPACGR